jgi:hypothetical protein
MPNSVAGAELIVDTQYLILGIDAGTLPRHAAFNKLAILRPVVLNGSSGNSQTGNQRAGESLADRIRPHTYAAL